MNSDDYGVLMRAWCGWMNSAGKEIIILTGPQSILSKHVCVILYLLSRYMRPEGPWQRLRRCQSNGGGSIYISTFSLAPGPA